MSDEAVRILHIEDNEEHRYVVRRMLERAGFKVVGAATGTEGLRCAFEEPVDLIILDIRLPDVSGFEVCHRLKSDPRTHRIPVLHLSAHFTRAEDRAHGLERGADSYLVHPAEPIELVATVRALLRTKTVEEALEMSLERERAARHEAELHYEVARKANRAKDEFLATLSHELRTPLNIILGHTELLRMGIGSPGEMKESLDAIHRGARQQAELINDLLDISRIITGKLKLEVREVRLDKVVLEAVAGQRLAASAKGVHLALDNAASAGQVLGDAARLQQVVWNLVSNAVKFTPRGGSVSIRTFQRDSRAFLEVEDTGEGIDPEFLPYVFDRLRQEDGSMARQHGGLGLGLAISRHIVELHGGSIFVESKGKGQGARFLVGLPLASVHLDAERMKGLMASNGSDALEPLTGIQVLVVEDDTSSRLLVQKILEQAEAQVMALGSAAEALEWLRGASRLPDVYLFDIGLPEEDGATLLRKVRAMNNERGWPTRAVALTAYANEQKKEEILEAGFNLYVVKPVEWRRLTRIVAALGRGARDATTR